MKTKYDLFQDERHYGWVVDKRYAWINMLTIMQRNKPLKFKKIK